MSRIVSPDCRDQNHQKCPGDALGEAKDQITECQCPCHSAEVTDIESTIAAAITVHARATSAAGFNNWTCNGCGEVIHSGRKSRAEESLAAHQARAVLAELALAGNVEWGIRYGDGDMDEGYLYRAEALGDIARLRDRDLQSYDPANNEPMTLMMRHRVNHSTAWTAVEA